MSRTILVFTSGANEEFEEVSDAFTGVDVDLVLYPGSHLLKGTVPLPFVDSPEGVRYVGMKDIRQLAKKLGMKNGDHPNGEIAG